MTFPKESPQFQPESVPWGRELEYPGIIQLWLVKHLSSWTREVARIVLGLNPEETLEHTFAGQVQPNEIQKVMDQIKQCDVSPNILPVLEKIGDARPNSPYRDYRINRLRPGPDKARLYLGDPIIQDSTTARLRAVRHIFPFALLTESPLRITEWRNNKTPLLALLHHSLVMTVRLIKTPSGELILDNAPLTETTFSWSESSHNVLGIKKATLPSPHQAFQTMWHNARHYFGLDRPE